MKYLVDTNVFSELCKPSPNENCLAWVEANKGDCWLSAVTLSELRFWAEKQPAGKRRTELWRALDFLAQDYGARFADFDAAAAFEWGRYAAELLQAFGEDWWKQFDHRDTQIAAMAREYGFTVATRNEKHFPGVPTVNPFD